MPNLQNSTSALLAAGITDVTLFIVVGGTVMLALGVNVLATIGWLRRRP
jgi:hypothetical protein